MIFLSLASSYFSHVCIHTYIHTYVRTYIRTYIHTGEGRIEMARESGVLWRVATLFCVFPPEREPPSPTPDKVKGTPKESLVKSEVFFQEEELTYRPH